MDNHMVSGDTSVNVNVNVVVRTCRYPDVDLQEVVGAFVTRAQAVAFAAKRNGEQSTFLYAVLTVPLDSEDPDGLDAAQEAAYRAAPPAQLPEGEEADALDQTDGPTLWDLRAVYRGYPVRARRAPRGHWCGYITVPRIHPWAMQACTDEDGKAAAPDEMRLLGAIDMHGGCTYAEFEGGGITVGFDCAHCSDGIPPWITDRAYWGGTYRDLAFVRAQLLSLAEQAERAARDADG